MFKSHFRTVVKNEEELVKLVTNYIGIYDDSTELMRNLYKGFSIISKELVEEGKEKYGNIHYPCDLDIEFIQTKYGFLEQVMVRAITVDDRGFDKHVVLSRSNTVNQIILYDRSDVPNERVVYNLKGIPLLNIYLNGELVYLKHDINHISHIPLANEM